MKDLLIWVLKDNRPGNYSQVLNLAESLKIPYQIQEISYNKLAALPNFLQLGKFSILDQKSKNNLLNLRGRKPDIIISAGRRSALIALDLKKIYPHLFLIQIMNPGKNIKKFDLVITPKHDHLKGKNILEINGAITNISKAKIEENYQKFAAIFDQIKSPKIALFLGGSSKDAKFKEEDANKLRQITDKLCQNMKASLLITTSRRTDKLLIDELEKNNRNLKYCFKWIDGIPNPYWSIFQTADYLIVTGDSISMISEAANFGKPLFIYTNSNICSKKHQRFQQYLFHNSYACKLTDDMRKLDSKKLNKLDETNKIVLKIRDILSITFNQK